MCGDEVVSFDAVYAAEREGLVRLASLILGSTFAADDIVQDAFARLSGASVGSRTLLAGCGSRL